MGKRLKPATDKSLFVASRISGSVLHAVALTSASLAQDAGVSGIPPGPANGWNSRNPSFDAPQLPPIPPPTIRPVTPPTTVSPLNPSRRCWVRGQPVFPRCERDPRRRRHAARPSGRTTDCSVTASQASAEDAEVPRLFLEETATDKVHS
jgi:hypothetical protein